MAEKDNCPLKGNNLILINILIYVCSHRISTRPSKRTFEIFGVYVIVAAELLHWHNFISEMWVRMYIKLLWLGFCCMLFFRKTLCWWCLTGCLNSLTGHLYLMGLFLFQRYLFKSLHCIFYLYPNKTFLGWGENFPSWAEWYCKFHLQFRVLCQ